MAARFNVPCDVWHDEIVPRQLMYPRKPKLDGPEAVGDILGRLFTARGWGRRQARLHLEKAWADAATDHAPNTRVVNLRRGVLEIEVNNAVLLQELAHFHKRKLLERLRASLTGTPLTDLRFRAGTW